jgi:hypothetical protein
MKKGTKDLQKLLKSRNCKSIIYEKTKIKHLSRFINANIDE